MYIELLKGILNSDIAVQEKLEKISGIVERAAEIENRAMEYAAKRAKFDSEKIIEPTWEDRLKAVSDLKRKVPLQKPVLERQELKSVLKEAVLFLKRTVTDNGSWEISEPFQPFAPEEPPLDSVRPLQMLLVAPWEIGLCLSTLYDWIKSVRPDDKQALQLVHNGNKYLRRVQACLGNGGVGDSFWMEGTQAGASEARGNTLETCMAISTWGLESAEWPAEYHETAIEEGISYLESTWNQKEDGGWSFKPSWESDVKSTAMVVMVLLTLMIKLQPSSAKRRRYLEMSKCGLNWLLREQQNDGSWKYERKSKASRISGSFYAIQTMTLALFYFENHNPGGARKMMAEMSAARWKALRCYEKSQKFMGGDKGGWGWCHQDEASAVEETAASLIVLLDTGMLSEKSPMAEQAMKWLLSMRSEDLCWGAESAIVVKAATRMLHKKSRLQQKLRRRSDAAEGVTEASGR